jgi:hypothetical protein
MYDEAFTLLRRWVLCFSYEPVCVSHLLLRSSPTQAPLTSVPALGEPSSGAATCWHRPLGTAPALASSRPPHLVFLTACLPLPPRAPGFGFGLPAPLPLGFRGVLVLHPCPSIKKNVHNKKRNPGSGDGGGLGGDSSWGAGYGGDVGRAVDRQ